MDPCIITSQQKIYDLLLSNNLSEYFNSLIEQGGDDFDQLISCSEEEFMEICNLVGMTLKPLHIRRFKKALDSVKNDKITSEIMGSKQSINLNLYSGHLRSNFQNSIVEQEQKFCSSYNTSPKNKISMESSFLMNFSSLNETSNAVPASTLYGSFASPHKNVNDSFTIQNNGTYLNKSKESNKFQISNLVGNNDSNRDPIKDTQNSSYSEGESRIKTLGIQLPDIPHLIKVELMDSWRKDIIRNYAQIFGRDDTKRKTNRLSQTEELLNEVAFELCMRDPVLLLSRQRLLNAARQTLRDNGFGISPGALTTIINPNKTKATTNLSLVTLGKQVTSDDGSCDSPRIPSPNQNGDIVSSLESSNKINSMNSLLPSGKNLPEVTDPTNDYDLILIYKMFKRWPKNTMKTRKAFLRRKARLFEVVDGKLFYRNNDNSCLREWLRNRNEQIKAIESCHIEANGSHSFRERTLARVTVRFYWRTLTEDTYNYVDKCELCNDAIRHRMHTMESNDCVSDIKRTLSTKSNKASSKKSKVMKLGNYSMEITPNSNLQQVYEAPPVVQILPNDYYIYDDDSCRYIGTEYTNNNPIDSSLYAYNNNSNNYEQTSDISEPSETNNRNLDRTKPSSLEKDHTIDNNVFLIDSTTVESSKSTKTNEICEINCVDDNHSTSLLTSEYLSRHEKPSIIVPVPDCLSSYDANYELNNRIVLSIKKITNQSSVEDKPKYSVTDTKILVN